MVPVVGNYVRPWHDEKLVGEIVAVSGDILVCRMPGNMEFCVRLSDVRSGRIRMYRSRLDALAPNVAPIAERLSLN